MLKKLSQEGGVEFANFLLAKAICAGEHQMLFPSRSDPPARVLPGPSHLTIREWTFNDIQRLTAAEQTEWRIACCEELEALKRRHVYDLVD